MTITYPRPGVVTIAQLGFLANANNTEVSRFLSAVLGVAPVQSVAISVTRHTAEIRFQTALQPSEMCALLAAAQVSRNAGGQRKLPLLRPDADGSIEIRRYDGGITTWTIASDIPGRIRLRNGRLFRRKRICQDVERELMTVFGVQRFHVNPVTGSVLVHYDPNALEKAELIDFLERTLVNIEDQPHLDRSKHELLLCTASVGLAAVAQFAAPVLLLPAAGLLLYCVYPTFIDARNTLFAERRLGVDVLDAIVVVMCLISMEIFAGAVLAWCLSFGRALLTRAQEDSRRRLVNLFGKQPRTAYVFIDGVETLTPLDLLKPGDIIAVRTGEAIAADGTVWEGHAVVDQHALTGESVPVEKEPGSRVFASTLVVGGRLLIRVESAGKDTATAKISAILNNTASFRLSSQSRGEQLADKAVIPTLALAGLGLTRLGLPGATAIINCDFGTGIRMAAPLALLSSLSVCSNRGILIKDGRALEQMDSIDTVLFDKTGTLTHEKPEVHCIHCFGDLDEETLLMYAAAAEHRLEHPIAVAIVEKFRKSGKPFPATDNSSFQIGYGIRVRVNERTVLVGSSRFMELENAAVSDEVKKIQSAAHEEGHSIVFIAVDGLVAGAIELAPRLRAGVREVIAGLRSRGVTQIAIISGDHDRPTRKLAQEIGVDRYFAQVLPEEKAAYVELLQKEGRKVCFVGDGINDSIALKRANVSVSLRGATSVATDTAQIVFMEDNLWKLCEFADISRNLERNVNLSWYMILAPNLLCIAGAFFLGFGVMASVLANNVAAIAALANGLRPRGMYSVNLARTPRRMSFAWRGVSFLVRYLLKRGRTGANRAPAVSTAADLTFLAAGFPAIRQSASFYLWTGLAGVILPGVPGIPLLIIALAIYSAGKPEGSALDNWIAQRFPGVRTEALRFAHNLMRDVQRRFPEGHAVHNSLEPAN